MFFRKHGIIEEVGMEEIPLDGGCLELSVQGKMVHVAQ
jgi:hypothetical protein